MWRTMVSWLTISFLLYFKYTHIVSYFSLKSGPHVMHDVGNCLVNCEHSRAIRSQVRSRRWTDKRTEGQTDGQMGHSA